MPGIFGASGGPAVLGESLRREFESAWDASEAVPAGEGVLGGHAFPPGAALHTLDDRRVIAVDGEEALYRVARDGASRLLQRSPVGWDISEECCGNLAMFDPATRVWTLAADWVGSFPLYYAQHEGALLFCSRLLPLARVLGAERDLLGIAEFLIFDYTFAGRTFFKGIRRLLPGQLLSFATADGTLRVREASELWAGRLAPAPSEREADDAAWKMLNAAIRARVAPGPTNALLLSAGWDSRLLLCGLRDAGALSQVLAYSHGDQQSREMRIIARLAGRTGARLRLEAQRENLYDLDLLREWHERTETILFPHWHLAGRNLREEGVRTAFSGVYGEILGGHYGPAMLLSGREKIGPVLESLVGKRPDAEESAAVGRRAIEHFVERKLASLPRSFGAEFRSTIASQSPALRQDLASDLDRLERRGVATRDQLVEAFVAEHRGTQYINAQVLSLRAFVDVAMPFTDRALLALASRLPLPAKIQNAMHRRLLRRHGRDLLRYGTAATALPADAPIVFQESARAWRWAWEAGAWKTYWWTHGRLGPPRPGWCNYEFLRRSPALVRVVDDLEADLWDRDALHRRLSDSASFKDHRLVYPDAFLRLYGVDLTLRRTRS